MKKYLLAILALILTATHSFAFIDSYTIDREDLPEEARALLDEHFPKAKVTMIKVDRHLLKKTDYDVKLTNGAKIEFSNKGKWTSIDCGKKEVPADLIPKSITKYIAKNFEGQIIVSIKKRNAGHDVTLSDGTEHHFNALHQYKGIKNPL